MQATQRRILDGLKSSILGLAEAFTGLIRSVKIRRDDDTSLESTSHVSHIISGCEDLLLLIAQLKSIVALNLDASSTENLISERDQLLKQIEFEEAEQNRLFQMLVEK